MIPASSSTAEITFDIVESARKTKARLRRRRATPFAVGAAALSAGIVLGGALGSGISACGLYIVAKAVNRASLRRWYQRLTTPGDPRARPSEPLRDQVDEASWESFPASDPPAFAGAAH